MEEYINNIKPLLDLALSEGGNGMLYISLGAVLGVVFALIFVFSLYIFASRKSWPTRAKWGRISRIVFLVYASISVSTAAAGVGAAYGLISSVASTISKQELIEKASVEGLNQVVAFIYVEIESELSNTDLSEDQLNLIVDGYISGERKIELGTLRERMHFFKEGIVRSAVEKIDQKYGYERNDVVARIGSYIASRAWSWLAEAKIESLFSSVDDVIGSFDKEFVTTKEISFEFGRSFIKPYIDKKIEGFRKTTLVLGGIQILILLLPPVGILWLFGIIQNRKLVREVSNQTDY